MANQPPAIVPESHPHRQMTQTMAGPHHHSISGRIMKPGGVSRRWATWLTPSPAPFGSFDASRRIQSGCDHPLRLGLGVAAEVGRKVEISSTANQDSPVMEASFR